MAKFKMSMRAGFETIIELEFEGRPKWVDSHFKRALGMMSEAISSAIAKAAPEEVKHG